MLLVVRCGCKDSNGSPGDAVAGTRAHGGHFHGCDQGGSMTFLLFEVMSRWDLCPFESVGS